MQIVILFPMDEKRSTAEVWRERIETQRASGMSIRGWCRENDVHEHGFYWWRNRLKILAGKTGRREVRPARFTEVVVTPSAMVAAEPIRLHLGDGRELVLPGTMAVAVVAALVAAVVRAMDKPL